MGFSVDPKRRLKQLQTANNEKLELLYVIEGDKIREQSLHSYFANFHISGEWYDYEKVYEFIKRERLTKMVMEEEGII